MRNQSGVECMRLSDTLHSLVDAGGCAAGVVAREGSWRC